MQRTRWVLAESLYVAGVHAEVSRDPERADAFFAKARRLYALLDPDLVVSGHPDARDRIGEIDRRLGGGMPDTAS